MSQNIEFDLRRGLPKLKFASFYAQTFAKVVDNNFRAQIFCPRKTKDILTKHDETGSPEQQCMLMHCHKSITDTLNLTDIVKRFSSDNDLRKGHFGKFD